MARFHLPDVVLESSERGNGPVEHLDAVTNQAYLVASHDLPVLHVATRDVTGLRHLEYFADIDGTDDLFFLLRRQKSLQCLVDIVDRIVNNAVRPNVDLFLFGQPAGVEIRADPEADDHGSRGGGKNDV